MFGLVRRAPLDSGLVFPLDDELPRQAQEHEAGFRAKRAAGALGAASFGSAGQRLDPCDPVNCRVKE